MQKIMLFLAAAALTASAVTVTGQQVASGNLAKLRQTAAYQKAVIAGAYKTTAWVNDTCKDAKPSIGTQLAAHTMPIVVNVQLQPRSGAWIEHVAVAGCSRPWQLNVLLQVLVPGSIATVALLPGSTHADPVLQKDATLYAFLASSIDPKGCRPIYVADTTFVSVVGGPPAVAGKPAWSERWSVMQCQKRTEVEMRFTPDRTGTTISTRRVGQPI